ncbi:hypothetical protein HOF46_02620 [Candidatus Woesearchaeota archaeon]|jgi:hypothetical protein|nr:hypothetical protein [Candidatus Woesearchaeota archaeon]
MNVKEVISVSELEKNKQIIKNLNNHKGIKGTKLWPVFNKTSKLRTESYDIYKKGVVYSDTSTAIMLNKANHKTVEVGDIETDYRIHTMVILPPDRGKNELKQGRKRVLSNFNSSIQEVTHIHPEQFIGKVERIKNTTVEGGYIYKTILGYLAGDVIWIDEGREFMTSPEYKLVRAYMRIALDTYGSNLILKGGVNIPEEQRISYFPHANLYVSLQPKPMGNEFLDSGNFRRFIVLYNQIPDNEVAQALVNRINKIDRNPLPWNKILSQFKKITIKDVEATENAKFLLKYIPYNLLTTHLNTKKKRITDFFIFTTQNNLLKLSIFQSIIRSANITYDESSLSKTDNLFNPINTENQYTNNTSNTSTENEVRYIKNEAKNHEIRYTDNTSKPVIFENRDTNNTNKEIDLTLLNTSKSKNAKNQYTSNTSNTSGTSNGVYLKITSEDVSNAYIDLKEFFMSALNFCEEFVTLYKIKIPNKLKIYLRLIYNETPDKLIEKIDAKYQKINKIPDTKIKDACKNIRTQLKAKGLTETKQVGKARYEIFLTDKGNEVLEGDDS